ncbi:TolC family protein [uncultured Hymenobacter sp.]|uniref:TolC family protein n=1 Tax=uncultured Hymenobacter sp. TaxID=170016 RepID=UPI0035CC9639
MLLCFKTAAPWLLGAGLLMAAPAWAQTPAISDSLDLDGTLRSVLDANPAVTSLEEQVNAAAGRLAQTRTGLLPQVTGTATYTYLNPVARAAFPAGPGGEIRELQFVPHNNYDAHITAQYLLLDFGRNAATLSLSEAQRQTAQDNVTVARRDLAFTAAQTYYNILFMRESIRVQDEQVASLQVHRREMEKRVQGGVSTRFDVTTTDVRITQAQNTKLDLENQLRNQQVQLARLLHKPQQTEVPVRGRLGYQLQAVDLSAELAKALENRPEVKLARDAERTADLQLRLVEKSNLPSLGTGAQVGGKNGFQPDINQFRANFTGVVQLSVPIYDGHKNRNQRVEALANIRGQQARTQDAQEQIRADVRQAVNNLTYGQARFDNATQQIAQATDALTRARARYRYDVGTNLDVLDAETSLAQARLARAQAMYNYTLGQFQLRRATGEQIWQ